LNNQTIDNAVITGESFFNGAGLAVKLVKASQSDIVGTDIQFISPTELRADFDLNGKAVGYWGVKVINPDTQSATLTDGFNITYAPPSVSVVTPETGPTGGGTGVTVSGANYLLGGSRAAGGTVTAVGGYIIHTFTSSGVFTPEAGMSVEVLVVAGGGSGGGSAGTSIAGGGGGGGGVTYNSSIGVLPQTYVVTVGAGGIGQTGFVAGRNGGNSVFLTLTAIGGGYGGTWTIAPTTGGSGGGAGENGQSLDGAAGTSGQGYAGGNDNGYNSGAPSAGGGGGEIGRASCRERVS
jgi:hypothetical protein